jgi:hypothetical protein
MYLLFRYSFYNGVDNAGYQQSTAPLPPCHNGSITITAQDNGSYEYSIDNGLTCILP